MNTPIRKLEARRAVFFQQQRSIQINDFSALCHQHGGRHCQGRADHAADHDLKPQRFGAGTELERLGQATGLVELDVHHVIPVDQIFQTVSRMHAFIGANRHRTIQGG